MACPHNSEIILTIIDMTHRYLPHTPDDIARMLDAIGVETLDDLYADVPDSLRLARPYCLPEEMSEKEVRDFFDALGRKNRTMTCFAGAGYYHHYAPALIQTIISRSEFLTAYTPYQPEISQGTLHYIFEYQSMMAELTGLDVSNASMYDGTTAAAEAMLMMNASMRRGGRILTSATMNPRTLAVMRTYAHFHGIDLEVISATADGVTDRALLEERIAAGGVAGVVLPSPNYFGILEDFSGIADCCHAVKALLAIDSPASALAVIRSAGEWGADIACGDAQSLGMPLNYGGPSLGYLCATKALMRKMPGRIVGATVDRDGQRVFVLTLQAREQHIRREKATSNICSNQGLMTLYAAIYLSLMGRRGLEEVNRRGMEGAHYLADRLAATGAMSLTYPGSPFLNEFVMTVPAGADRYLAAAADRGILGGVKVDDTHVLIAVTEMQTRADMDTLAEAVGTCHKN